MPSVSEDAVEAIEDQLEKAEKATACCWGQKSRGPNKQRILVGAFFFQMFDFFLRILFGIIEHLTKILYNRN